jgi:hypothetical protein
MSNTKYCGRYANKVSSCSSLTTQEACGTKNIKNLEFDPIYLNPLIALDQIP